IGHRSGGPGAGAAPSDLPPPARSPDRSPWRSGDTDSSASGALMSPEALSAILASGVAMAIPLLLAAPGELFAERAGVINVGLEGMMLVGALAGVAGAFFGRSPWLGLLAGILGSTIMAALFALVAVTRGADQVVAGTALNLLALGATGAAFRAITEGLGAPPI